MAGNRQRRARIEEEQEARWSDWLARANAGDADTYSKLLHEIGDVIDRYLRRRFGEMDFIEDWVQECLLSIHRALPTYDPGRPFKPWMFAIVRHKAIDLLRRRGTRRRFEAHPEAQAEAAAPATDPTAALQAARALQELAPHYRDALVLTKLQGHSLDEAARHAGVSVTAMKSRVHRAIRQVRRLLALEDH